MNNRIVSRSLMGALCSACFTTVSAQERPNIIVFLVDDMGLSRLDQGNHKFIDNRDKDIKKISGLQEKS